MFLVRSCKARSYSDNSQLHVSYEPKENDLAIDEKTFDRQSIARWLAGNGQAQHWQVDSSP